VPRAAARGDADISAALAALPAAHYPRTVEVAGEMADYASDRHYDLVIDQFVAGIRPGRTARRPRA
jgi:hypothetical protein